MVALFAVPLFAALPAIRAAARYPIWKSALETEGGAYDFHFLDQYALAAWPVWERLDSPPSKRIAVTCGWDGRGQSWYLYPLMGSRLQNQLVYVPPTLDGGIVDYQDVAELNRRVQLRAWLRRLLDSGIDHVVTLQPSPPERLSWIVRLPEVFVPEAGDDAGDTWLYRLDRGAAARMLETP